MLNPSRLLEGARRVARFTCSLVSSSVTRLAVGAATLVAAAPLAFAQTATKAATAPVEKVADVTWWQAIILGLVQGLTEFIPVSSSAHLNITHYLLGQNSRQLPFDVFLSVGTIVALAWYFFRDWKGLLTDPRQKWLLYMVLLACVPAVLVAAFSPIRHWEDTSKYLYSPFYNGLWLIIGGALLFVADRVGSKKRPMSNIKNGDALIIGASQALALIPGFSRSGSTIMAGLFLGLKREDAARFSFLMSLPISIGAVVYEARGLVKAGSLGAGPLEAILGVTAAAVSGFWAISFLLRYLSTRGMAPFFIWRVVVGIGAMIIFFSRR
ncbi:undecaprenyl-diphosphate phosphatase [bacterium]|nr:MAG: undecaprenyl-diphosphate phosphatase [bacterium]